MNKFKQVLIDGHQMSLAGGPEVIKFEQVSSDSHQMSLAEGPLGWGWGFLSREVPFPRGALYSEVQCPIGNRHMGYPPGQTDTTENITFSGLRWRAVNIQYSVLMVKKID